MPQYNPGGVAPLREDWTLPEPAGTYDPLYGDYLTQPAPDDYDLRYYPPPYQEGEVAPDLRYLPDRAQEDRGWAQPETLPASYERPAEQAPDFVRNLPSSAVARDERVTQGDDFMAGVRSWIGDRWQDIRESQIAQMADQYLGDLTRGRELPALTGEMTPADVVGANVGMVGELVRGPLAGPLVGIARSAQALQQSGDELRDVTARLASIVNDPDRGPEDPEAKQLEQQQNNLSAELARRYPHGFAEEGPMAAELVLPLLDPTQLIFGIPGRAGRVEHAIAEASGGLRVNAPAARLIEGMAPEIADELGPVVAAFNRSAPEGEGIAARISEAIGLAEEALIDSRAPLNRIGPRTEELATAVTGWDEGAYTRMRARLAPVAEALGEDAAARAESYAEFQTSVGLERYIEAAGIKENPERLGAGGLTSVTEAHEKLAALEEMIGPESAGRLENARAALRDAWTGMLDETVEAGNLSEKAAAVLKETQPNYNPTILEKYVEEAGAGGKGGRANLTSVIKRLTVEGNEGEQIPPMQAAIDVMLRTDVANRRNDLVRTIVQEGGFEAKPVLGLTKGLEIGRTMEPGLEVSFSAASYSEQLRAWQEAKAAAKEIGEKFTASRPKPPDILGTVITRRPGQLSGYLFFRDDGRLMQAPVPPDIERTVNNLGGTQNQFLQTYLNIGRSLNRTLYMGAVVVNPSFLATNAGADAIQGIMREGITPPQIMRGYMDALVNGPLNQQYMAAGGGLGRGGGLMISGAKQRSLEEMETEVLKEGGVLIKNMRDLGALQRAIDANDMGSFVKYMFKLGPITDIGSAIERGPHLAAFGKRLAEGATEAEALQAGKRVTGDFSRAGAVTRYMNPFIPFLTANIEGTTNVARTLRDNRDDPAFRLRLAGLLTGAVALHAWNSQQPQDKDWPDYLIQNYAHLTFPEAVPNPRGPGYDAIKGVFLPIRSWAAVTLPIDGILDFAEGKSPGLLAFANNWINAASPLPSGGGPLGLVSALSTAPGRTALEVTSNYDYFRGHPIESEHMKGLLPELRYTPRTSAVSRLAGTMLATTGVPDYLKSPTMLDHIVTSLAGGGGRIGLQAISSGVLGQETDKPYVVGGLLSGYVRNYGGAMEQRAYEGRDADLERLINAHRPMIRAVEENLGTGSITTLRRDIEGVILYPAEQVFYEATKLATAKAIFAEEHINDDLSSEPLADRRELLQEILAEASEVAADLTLARIPMDEVDRRLALREEPNPRRALPVKTAVPIPVR